MGKDLREQYLMRFKEWYLGKGYQALGAKILNDSVLFFFPGEKKEFEVLATAPLIIRIPHSAYNIRCDLRHFRLQQLTSREGVYHCSILGHYYFEEVVQNTRREARLMARKRNELYYNSRQHFCRSLYRNQLAENGYMLQAKCPGQLKEQTTGLDFRGFTRSHIIDKNGEKVLFLTDFKCHGFYIYFYQNKRMLPLDLSYRYPHPNNLKHSGMVIAGDTVRIYSTGRVPDNRIFFNGIIGNKGVAHMLPEDYDPSKQ